MHTADHPALGIGAGAGQDLGGPVGRQLGQDQAPGPAQGGVAGGVGGRGRQEVAALHADVPGLHQIGALAVVAILGRIHDLAGVDADAGQQVRQHRRRPVVQGHAKGAGEIQEGRFGGLGDIVDRQRPAGASLQGPGVAEGLEVVGFRARAGRRRRRQDPDHLRRLARADIAVGGRLGRADGGRPADGEGDGDNNKQVLWAHDSVLPVPGAIEPRPGPAATARS